VNSLSSKSSQTKIVHVPSFTVLHSNTLPQRDLQQYPIFPSQLLDTQSSDTR
jgi:hypothetical protein